MPPSALWFSRSLARLCAVALAGAGAALAAAPAPGAEWPLERKVAQLLMVHDQEISPEEARTLGVGAILLGPQDGHRRHVRTPADWRAYTAAFGPAWLPDGAPVDAWPAPILLGIDAVHGHALIPGATVFPHNLGLAAGRDPALLRQLGAATAAELIATGANWALAPAVGSTPDPRWGRTYEGWGADYASRAGLVAAFIRGLQETRPAGRPVIACAKHFLADGEPTWGTGKLGRLDQGDVTLTEAELRARHLPPYVEAVAADAATVMVSYGSWRGRELHHHAPLLNDTLRHELGFAGLVVSDFNGFFEEGEDAGARAVSSVRSGVDLLMVGKTWRAVHAALLAAARDGTLPADRLDQALGRILAVKARLRLAPDAPPDTDRAAFDALFAAPTHRALARRAAAAGTTLVFDRVAATHPARATLVPFPPDSTVLLLGPAADHAGIQAGGWTIKWGGLRDPNHPDLVATTLLGALRKRLGPRLLVPSDLTAPDPAELAALAARADLVLVALGEPPTAEWFGDSPAPALPEAEQVRLATALALGRPTLAVVFSGRPLDLGPAGARLDALVAAWLPGSAGEGLADVLLGDAPPATTSPLPWTLAFPAVTPNPSPASSATPATLPPASANGTSAAPTSGPRMR